MAFPAAPTESGTAKIHFLTTDGNAAAGWVAIETGTTGTGSNTVGWAGVATHVEGDEVADPGDITTSAAPVVLVAGDNASGNAGALQLDGSDFLKVILQAGTAEIGKLAAGTAGIGKLTANSGVDIGDVDVTSVVPGTTATSLGKAEDAAHTSADTGVMALVVRRDANTSLVGTDGDYAPLQVDVDGKLKVEIFDGGDVHSVDWNGTAPPIGAGTEAAALRVTVATDSTGLVSVDDGGGTLTVDSGAAFTVQEDGAALTALQIMDDWDESDRAKVNLIAGQAGVTAAAGNSDASTQRVVIATDQAVISVDDNAGSLTVDGNVGDNGPGFTTVFKYLAKSTTADATLWDPAAGKEVVVTDVIISVSGTATDVNLAFGSGTSLTTQFIKFHGDVRGGLTHTFRSPIRGGADNNLNISLSAAQAMTITVSGYEETP